MISMNFFFCEVGFLQDVGDQNGEATNGRSIIRDFRFFAFGWRVAVFFTAVGSSGLSTMTRGFSWARIFTRYFSVGLGSFRER